MSNQTVQLIQISAEQLQKQIIEGVKIELETLKKHFEPRTPTELLTRNEVSNMFKIDLSSVHNWTKKGILISYQISGRVYFKRSEIENAIIELKK